MLLITINTLKYNYNYCFKMNSKRLDLINILYTFNRHETFYKMLSLRSMILLCILSTVCGDRKKPSYLYDTPETYTLATRIEPKIFAAIKHYVENTTTAFGSCCTGNKTQGGMTLGLMKGYIMDYESSSINTMNGSTNASNSSTEIQLVSNPFLVHKLINRFARVLPQIVRSLKEQPQTGVGETFLKSVRLSKQSSWMYPTKSDDLANSLESLLRIQRFHNFETKDMAEGRLGALDTEIKLSAEEAFDLGYTARPMDFASSIEWLETSLEKLDREGSLEDLDEFRDMVQKELEEVVAEHDDVCSNPVWNPEMETCFMSLIKSNYYGIPTSTGIPNGRIKAWITNQKKSALLHRETGHSLTYDLLRNFISTCAGNILMSEEGKSKLRCWYEWKKAAYLTIAPLKFEQLSASPELYQVYDILGPKKIRRLKQYTGSGLERSRVGDEAGGSLSDARTSVQTRLKETSFLDSISKQIEVATGLNARSIKRGVVFEPYQIASYRPSHHYGLHKDVSLDKKEEPEDGDRLATFMFYLSDVEVGGWTGFPIAGVAAKPVSGSAIFWYNLKKNGDVDHSTYHGGCPVAYGVKVVMTKWILYKQNFDKRPCSLIPEE